MFRQPSVSVFVSVLLSAASLAACLDEPEVPPPGEPLAVPDDGGVAVVRTATGVRHLPWRDVGGRAIHQGDIDLGPVDELRSPFFGGGVHRDLSKRWPDNRVFYTFHENVTATTRDDVEEQIAQLERILPLDFRRNGSVPNRILIIEEPDGSSDAGGFSAVGMQGGQQEMRFIGPPSARVIRHEILHALGLFHEQERPDRQFYIDIHEACIEDWWQYAYDQDGDSLELGPYDYRSVMHYRTGAFCVDDPTGSCVMSDGTCRTMTKADSGGAIGNNTSLSREDVNTLWRMYAPRLDDSEASDRTGQALAVGDFNGDGYDDVAVGAPGEAIGGEAGAGRVLVFRGTSKRLVPWQMIDQGDFPEAYAVESGDAFGAALAAGDVDGDGIDDLVVGAPGEDIGTVADAGAVAVLHGDAGGFTLLRNLNQAELGFTHEAGDRFGHALVVVPLATETQWRPAVVIGAPVERNGAVRSGAAFVWAASTDAGSTAEIHHKIFDAAAPDRANFGAAFAAGQLDGGVRPELVIGAFAQGNGEVYVYTGRTPNLSSPAPVTFRQRITAPADAGDFGFALAIGNVRGPATSAGELVIGAPGFLDGSGVVYVFQSTSLVAPVMAQVQRLHQGASEAGDRYGSAVAAGNFDPASDQDDLVIGVPGENLGAGALSTFRGNDGDATPLAMLLDDVFSIQLVETEDELGTAVAIGNFNGAGDSGSSDDFGIAANHVADVVVGIPGEGFDLPVLNGVQLPEGPSNAGAFGVLRGDSGGGLDAAGKYFQNSGARD